MVRSLATGFSAAISAETSTLTHLIELNTSDGATRLTTSPTDISWDSNTWTGIGGALVFGAISETDDGRAQGVEIRLSGVEQTIINLILSYNVRGREARIYIAHIAADGTIVADPYQAFSGYLNDRWKITEERQKKRTVTITTRMVSRVAVFQKANPVRANIHSHREMLRRSGATGAALSDTFFTFLPKLVGKPIYWGNTPYRPGEESIYTGRTAKRR
jgi:hypothetical protein